MKIMQKKDRENALLFVISKLFYYLNITYNKKNVSMHLKSHYYYPSILSINDFLIDYGFTTHVYKIIEKNILLKSKFPLISLYDKNNYILITKISETNITYLNVQNGLTVEKWEEFERKWTRIVIEVEKKPLENKIEKKDKQSFISNKIFNIFLFIIGTCIGIICINIETFGFDHFLTSFSFFVGCILAFLLLKIDYQEINPYIKRICHIRTRFNCQTVASSPYATVLGDIRLYECVGLYFSGMFLFSLLSLPHIEKQHQSINTLLCIFSIITIPFIILSLYQQFIVIKRICLFCLLIDGILLFNIMFFINKTLFKIPDLSICYIFLFSFLIPIVICKFLRKKISALYYYDDLCCRHEQLASNPIVVDGLVNSNDKIYNTGIWEHEFILGNSKSNNKLTIILNLTCNQCGEKFNDCISFIEKHPELVSAQIRFYCHPENSIAIVVFKHILNLVLNNNTSKALVDIKEWYNVYASENSDKHALLAWRKTISYINDYSYQQNILMDSIINKHFEWCIYSSITHTPLSLLNGKEIPSILNIKNLKYYLIESSTI
jgi:uncharacterized membrane protein